MKAIIQSHLHSAGWDWMRNTRTSRIYQSRNHRKSVGYRLLWLLSQSLFTVGEVFGGTDMDELKPCRSAAIFRL